MGKIVKLNKEDKKLEINYYDFLVYILLLTTLLILTHSIKNYYFTVGYIELTYSLFLLPFIYFIINLITKKYGYQGAIKSISISGVSLVLFVVLVGLFAGSGFSFNNIYGEFCAYVVSCFINLTIYYFLLLNTKMPGLLVFLNYIFVLITYYFVYMLFSINAISFEYFWISYFSTLVIQVFICGLLTFIDKYIKRGV